MSLQLSINNELGEISRVLQLLQTYVHNNFVEADELVQRASIVVDEVLSNIIHHGFQDQGRHVIQIQVINENGSLHMHFIDDGAFFNPLTIESPRIKEYVQEQKIGGLGIHILKNISSDLRYHRAEERNHLRLSISPIH